MDLCCCESSFSISLVGRWGLLFPREAGFSRVLGLSGCAGLSLCTHVASSQTRGWTRVPCFGRWVLHHWTTREVPALLTVRETLHWAKTVTTSKCLPVAHAQNHNSGSQDSSPAETPAFSSFKLTPGNRDAIYNSVETRVHICRGVCALE